MRSSFVRLRLVVAIATFICVGSCSDSSVQERSWITQLTTDASLHTVELFRERTHDEPESGKYEYVYSVRFPQSAYTLEDNHFHHKQSTIRLMLDRRTFRSFAELIGVEAGIREGLDFPGYKTSALAAKAFRDPRSITVSIRGSRPPRWDDGATARCPKNNCTFSRYVRGSTIDVTIPSDQFKQGDELADRVVRFIEQSIVPRGTRP